MNRKKVTARVSRRQKSDVWRYVSVIIYFSNIIVAINHHATSIKIPPALAYVAKSKSAAESPGW
jgi:hypothetical protein